MARSSGLNKRRWEVVEKENLISTIMTQYEDKSISRFEFVKMIVKTM